MALSQIQCLDEHHVNWRVSESKPEFFYCEDQRLALEALVARGRDAFTDLLRQRGVRGFLSEPELERIARTAEAYRPGHEHHEKPATPVTGNVTPGSGEDAAGDGEVSLQYWPDRSEASVAELDLGWPDAVAYRGITRVTVHTQPPREGQTHIKEVVRKSIASAQKVIAVVMDSFTDVDIFRDLLDAAYKRRVAVYIIIDMAAVPCFLSMCGRADMHRGHLKNLRVRCCGGVDFFTRSAQKVRGSLSQKFLLVDGDRAISGSYSFTWSSSRLDRNLITVITGQPVETFDQQFRELFLLSRGVSLGKVPMSDEPAPVPVPQAAPVPVPASVARKLINPKYALVATGTHTSPSSSDQNSSNKNSQNPSGLKLRKGRLKHVSEEPPIHPGLAHLEKAYLIPYLPTWPEPDPPSDVIGFINIRDEKRAHQVHLQRSERFEVSQAIRFRSPLTLPADTDEPQIAGAEKPQPAPRTTCAAPSAPDGETGKPAEEQKCSEHTEETDSKEPPPPPQPHTPPPAQDSTRTHSPAPESGVTANTQPADTAAPAADAPAVAPPVPKRRTLHLVIDAARSEQTGPPQVTLVKLDRDDDRRDGSPRVKVKKSRADATLENGGDSGSNGNDSQDSTKVMCDRAAHEDPSSASTTSEDEFYDCSQQQQQLQSDPVTNGVTVGSGHGHRQGDGVNMMARFSQSMLDLREPAKPEDYNSLLRQSQHLRRQSHGSPHRHIGQLFQMSRSPVRDGRRGAKVILAKPGSFHRPARATAHVIGGHRYWQGQTPQPEATRENTRSGRSPRRHSPGPRKADHSLQQQVPVAPALLGISFSRLSNFRQLKARGAGSEKKTPQNNKANR